MISEKQYQIIYADPPWGNEVPKEQQNLLTKQVLLNEVVQ